jgi:hypothetical protein
VTEASRDEWYRLVAAVLRVLAVLATIIRPADVDRHTLLDTNATAAARDGYAKAIYDAVVPRLNAHDIDQEVKECAIAAAGTLLAHMADAPSLTGKVATMLATLTERTRSETTRIPTLRALAYIASSPLSDGFAELLVRLLPELSAFLRQASRPLRQQVRDERACGAGGCLSPCRHAAAHIPAVVCADVDHHERRDRAPRQGAEGGRHRHRADQRRRHRGRL